MAKKKTTTGQTSARMVMDVLKKHYAFTPDTACLLYTSHLHGMDLVLYYMERFALEHTFCEYFREELPEFIRRYEQQKGVTVEYLGLNLCELLWYQCFASLTLFQQPSLLLAEQDVERLRALLQHRSIKDAVHRVNQALEASMGTSVADYLTLFEEQLQAQLQAFVDAEHALLVYEEAVDDCFVLELTQGRDEETFLEDVYKRQIIRNRKEDENTI